MLHFFSAQQQLRNIDIMTKVLGVSWLVVDTVLNGISTGICGHIQVHMMSIWPR